MPQFWHEWGQRDLFLLGQSIRDIIEWFKYLAGFPKSAFVTVLWQEMPCTPVASKCYADNLLQHLEIISTLDPCVVVTSWLRACSGRSRSATFFFFFFESLLFFQLREKSLNQVSACPDCRLHRLDPQYTSNKQNTHGMITITLVLWYTMKQGCHHCHVIFASVKLGSTVLCDCCIRKQHTRQQQYL